MTIVALDMGTKRIGIAKSDATNTIATPLRVYERGEDPREDARKLAQIAEDCGAEKIVVGMPISLRGEAEIAARQVAQFVEILKDHTDLAVITWDERMTTKIAERTMLEADASRGERRHEIDKVAAALILQSFLDGQQQ